MVAETGCDAVMIGRTAASNPWIFRQIAQYTTYVAAGVPTCQVERSSAALTSGAEAPDFVGVSSGTAEVVPFPNRSKPYDEPAESDRYQMIRTYFQMLIEEEMPGAEGKMKQFASWFTHGVPGGAALRKAIYQAKTEREILGRVEEFFEEILERCGAGTSPAQM